MDSGSSDSDATQSSLDNMTNEEIRKRVDKHRNLIVEKVIATDLTPFIPGIPNEIKSKIVNLNRTTSSVESTTELLYYLEGNDDADVWTCFLNALKLKLGGYPYVYKVLKGETSALKNNHHSEAIDRCTGTLYDTIDPLVIIDYLYEKSLITTKDMQQIRNDCTNHSLHEGMVTLLDRIPRREEMWYKTFLEILFSHSYEFLVKDIDPDIYTELEGSASKEMQGKKRKRKIDNEMCGDVQTGLQVNVSEENTSKKLKTVDNEICTEMNTDMDTDAGPEVKLPFELRKYQQELAELALKGENVLVIAPTGSGKTHVAMKIIQKHLDNAKDGQIRKVAFIVHQNALAKQQFQQIRRHSNYGIKEITGGTQTAESIDSVSTWLKTNDILVMTAQILVNAFAKRDVDITHFTLLIFDECHHAIQKHAYNQIMYRYFDAKFNENVNRSSLPQVVGLTASVGVGKAKIQESAKMHIKRIMANLDASYISTVMHEREQLEKFCRIAVREDINVQSRRDNELFGETIVGIMTNIEKYMQEMSYKNGLSEVENILRRPETKGREPYTQWLSSFKQLSFENCTADTRKSFLTCLSFLEAYHKTLMVYADVRVKDALKFLEQELRKLDANNYEDETVKMIKHFYQKCKQSLKHCTEDPSQQNPNLAALEETISRVNKNEEDMRAIVFVKTLDHVAAIESWMKDTPVLAKLNPERFVGTQANSEKGGMTKSNQLNVLQDFNAGKTKLLIATSVGEEGHDIKMCHLVIRYNHVTNEISMVQSRGRSRADGGMYAVIANDQEKTAEKEQINILREDMMNKATEDVQAEINGNHPMFLNDLEKLQRNAKIIRDLEEERRNDREIVEEDFKITCFKCLKFICMKSDLRKILDDHHAVVNLNIKERVVIAREIKPSYRKPGMDFGTGKMHCRGCKNKLGNVSRYNEVEFPLLTLGSILLDIPEKRNKFKSWKEVPINVPDLQLEQFQSYANSGKLIDD